MARRTLCKENALRYSEDGRVVHPPMRPPKPKALKTKKWVNITNPRMEKIYKHEVDKEGYEIAMAMYHMKMNEWLKLPTNNQDKYDLIEEDYRIMGRLIERDGLVIFESLPQEVGVVHHKAHIMSWEESLRFNPDKVKVNPQTTLDGVVQFAPPLRFVDFDIITSFGVKPNFLLEKEWLLHLINGERLSETAKQFLAVRKEEGRAMRGF